MKVYEWNIVSYFSEVSPHGQDWLAFVSLKWPLQQVLMRAGIAPQDHTSNKAPEAGSLIWLVTAQEESSACLHEGIIEIPWLETTFSHLRGQAEDKWQPRREEGHKQTSSMSLSYKYNRRLMTQSKDPGGTAANGGPMSFERFILHIHWLADAKTPYTLIRCPDRGLLIMFKHQIC